MKTSAFAASVAIIFAALVYGTPPKPTNATSLDTNLRRKTGELDSIKLELERGRKRLKSLQKEEGTHLSQLEQLSANIKASERYLAVLSRRIDSMDIQLRELEDSIAAARSTLALRQKAMEERIRSMYMADPMLRRQPFLFLDAMLASRSLSEALYRIRYFQELIRYDQILLGRIDAAKLELNERKKRLEERRAEAARLREGKRAEQQQLAQEQSQHRLMLEQVRARKTEYLAMIRQLEEAQRQLTQVIKRLMSKQKKPPQPSSVPPPNVVKKKGNFPWPMSGVVVQEFGKLVHPVYRTVTMNTGIDIMGAPNQPVSCVANGKVIHIGSMRGLGSLVIVEHADGILTIYANLSSVAVKANQDVAQGTVLGVAGRGATEAESRLHFEVRRFSEALNPREWLK